MLLFLHILPRSLPSHRSLARPLVALPLSLRTPPPGSNPLARQLLEVVAPLALAGGLLHLVQHAHVQTLKTGAQVARGNPLQQARAQVERGHSSTCLTCACSSCRWASRLHGPSPCSGWEHVEACGHAHLQVLQARAQVRWDNLLQQARAQVYPGPEIHWWGPLCLPVFQRCAEQQAGAQISSRMLCSKGHQIGGYFASCWLQVLTADGRQPTGLNRT